MDKKIKRKDDIVTNELISVIMSLSEENLKKLLLAAKSIINE